MASWRPTTALEEAFISRQPDHNFIYGGLTDEENKKERICRNDNPDYFNFENKFNDDETEAPTGYSLKIIRDIHEMAGTKQMGAQAMLKDWNTHENCEKEIVGMMRFCGLSSSSDLPLNADVNIPAVTKKKLKIAKKVGKTLPDIVDEDFFKVESTRMRNAKFAQQKELENNLMEIKPKLTDDTEISPKDEDEFSTSSLNTSFLNEDSQFKSLSSSPLSNSTFYSFDLNSGINDFI